MSGLKAAGFTQQRGFSLFEVLITVIVISIGLLGLAALQFAGLRAVNNAQEYNFANLLAQDIEERIRANQAAAFNYRSIALATGGSPPAAGTDCSTNNCDSTHMHDFDLLQWYQMINSGGPNVPLLPEAAIDVSYTGSTYTIAISWMNASGSQALNVQFQL